MLAASAVAECALDRLGKGPLAVPGWTNRIMATALSHVPRRILLPALAAAMRSAHQKAKKRLGGAESS